MAKQSINTGSSQNKGDGDPLRTAFTKINNNFDELYARAENTDAQTLSLVGDTLSISGGNSVTITHPTVPTATSELTNDSGFITANDIPTDFKGSVFADDSTLLVDAVNGTISWSVISNTPTTISGYGITDAFNGAYTYLDFNANQDAVVNTKYLVEVTVGGEDFRLPASASVGDQIVIINHPESVSNLSVQYYNSGVPTNFNIVGIGSKTEYIYTGTGATGGWINI